MCHLNYKGSSRFGVLNLLYMIAISILPGTHLHPSQVKHVRVKCLAPGHKPRNNVPTLRGEKHLYLIFLYINLHQPGFESTQQAAAIAKCYALNHVNHCATSHVGPTVKSAWQQNCCPKYVFLEIWYNQQENYPFIFQETQWRLRIKSIS